jgi:hypothetical protein
MKPTPGPWKIQPIANAHRINAPIKGKLVAIAEVRPTQLRNSEANACLMAAAPELLEALEDCIAFLDVCLMADPTNDNPDSPRQRALAAIAKAKGVQS